MGSKPPSSIGTTESWYVTAFTRGNDLPRNAQTLFFCQCAMGACPGAQVLRFAQDDIPYGLMAPPRTVVE